MKNDFSVSSVSSMLKKTGNYSPHFLRNSSDARGSAGLIRGSGEGGGGASCGGQALADRPVPRPRERGGEVQAMEAASAARLEKPQWFGQGAKMNLSWPTRPSLL